MKSTPPETAEYFAELYCAVILHVQLSDTLIKVKSKICVMADIEPEIQILYFEGRQFEENKTLAEYNIEENSTIHLSMNLLSYLDVYILKKGTKFCVSPR